ncbi:MAG: rhodanese-like domain-containing protein [Gemmatimonadota bacterium]|nr:rhodanese-like domain-containing protein [Gemmatimonadota bacterium]
MRRQVTLMLLVATGLFSTTAFSYRDITSYTLHEMLSRSEGLYLLDVREQDEFIVSHIEGAVLFPWTSGVLQERYGKLPVYEQIVVICHFGSRAVEASEFLDTVGGGKFADKVLRLEEGMNGWPYDVIEDDKALFSRQKVLAEIFVSSLCPDCYYANRYLDNSLMPKALINGNFVLIRNIMDTNYLPIPRERADFYKVYFTPTMVLNGVEEVDPLYLSTIKINSLALDSSTVLLDLQGRLSEEDGIVYSEVTVTASALMGPEEYGFFLVLTETGLDPATWEPPFYPESGDRVFNNTLRLMVTGQSGLPFTIQPGEAVIFKNEFILEDSWVADSCEVVVFVQNLETSQVLQAQSRMLSGFGSPDVLPAEIFCDFTGDGVVNVSDVVALLLYQRDKPGDPGGDFNGDGSSDIQDVIAMLLAQRDGACPEAD